MHIIVFPENHPFLWSSLHILTKHVPSWSIGYMTGFSFPSHLWTFCLSLCPYSWETETGEKGSNVDSVQALRPLFLGLQDTYSCRSYALPLVPTAIMGRCCSCHCHHHFGISHGSWNGREQLQQDLLTGLPLFFLNFKFLSFVLELKRLAFCWYPCTLHPTKNSLFCVAVNIGKEILRVRKNSHVDGFHFASGSGSFPRTICCSESGDRHFMCCVQVSNRQAMGEWEVFIPSLVKWSLLELML